VDMAALSVLGLIGISFIKPQINLVFNEVDSTTKCNFEQLGKEVKVAKDVLVSKDSRPPSQSSHDLSTP